MLGMTVHADGARLLVQDTREAIPVVRDGRIARRDCRERGLEILVGSELMVAWRPIRPAEFTRPRTATAGRWPSS